MSTDWTQTDSFADFLRDKWRREPYAEAATAAGCDAVLNAETVPRLIESGEELDVLVVRNGRLVSQHQPRSTEEMKGMLREGCSLVLRNTERNDPALGELAAQVEERLSGEVAIQLYMTPGGYHSFGWHYDYEEVIILQTGGTKEYRLRENTVNPRPTRENMPKDMKFELETTPAQGCTLVKGDWLHIPSGWWHMALARQNSLSISIGVLPRD